MGVLDGQVAVVTGAGLELERIGSGARRLPAGRAVSRKATQTGNSLPGQQAQGLEDFYSGTSPGSIARPHRAMEVLETKRNFPPHDTVE